MRFATQEWLAALVAELNRQPDLGRALAGLPPDAAVVVEADAAFPATAAAWGRHAEGRIAEWRMFEDEDDVLELEPAYVFRAPYGTWRDILTGGDPLQAAVSGRVRVRGDLEALVRRTGYRYVVDAALAALRTEF